MTVKLPSNAWANLYLDVTETYKRVMIERGYKVANDTFMNGCERFKGVTEVIDAHCCYLRYNTNTLDMSKWPKELEELQTKVDIGVYGKPYEVVQKAA